MATTVRTMIKSFLPGASSPIMLLLLLLLFAKQNAWFDEFYLKGVKALPGKGLNKMTGKEDERV